MSPIPSPGKLEHHRAVVRVRVLMSDDPETPLSLVCLTSLGSEQVLHLLRLTGAEGPEPTFSFGPDSFDPDNVNADSIIVHDDAGAAPAQTFGGFIRTSNHHDFNLNAKLVLSDPHQFAELKAGHGRLIFEWSVRPDGEVIYDLR